MGDITTASVVVYGCVMAMSLFGIVFNIMNLMILTRKSLRTHSTYTYLAGLAISDCFTLVFVLPVAFVRFLILLDLKQCLNHNQAIFEAYFFMPLSNTFSALSIWIASAVAVERFVFIKYPVTSKIYCKPIVACRVLLLLSVGCVTFHLPYFFTREVSSPDDHSEQDKVVLPASRNTSDLDSTENLCSNVTYTAYSSTTAYEVYRWLRVVMVQIVPWFVLAIFNCLLIRSFRKSRQLSRINSISSQSAFKEAENRLNFMLIAIIFESLILDVSIALTDHVSSAVIFGKGDDSFYDSVAYARLTLAENFIETLSHSINFVLYCLLNKNFVRELQLQCQCCCPRPIYSPTEGFPTSPRNSIDLRTVEKRKGSAFSFRA